MSSAPTPHALILPYPAQGHILPLMKLSYCLIERGVRITFINTHFNHNRIFATKASGQATFIGEEIDGINFVAIPDGLEPEDDRHDFGGLTQSLMKVMPSLLEELIRDNGGEFTCFVADINMAWALKIGKNLGLRTAAFWPAAAGLLDAIFSIPELIQKGVIDEHGALIKKEVIQLNPGATPLDSTNLPWLCFNDAYTEKIIFNYFITNNQATSNAEMMICNSYEEVEKPIFSKISRILPVAPLHSKWESRDDLNLCQFWPEDKQCIAWLDKQTTNSVIYASFGSVTIFRA
ncbi:UDP-glycosyltransferase 83A1-like [Phalaenopsis equestris]|uniref:UDP-glycosyltransferase 83A1-like n=1 Tax=Phalaenopsis equestris TaxID=78828 RepID=UPI0009E5E8AD|nr:UDP-glycosyltransferase 83A1-like [Phalaenopsis equestris]